MTHKTARFVTGSVWRHVIVMTLTNSIGLMALFLVDLIDLYFLNLLGEQEVVAAVGFSAQLLFYVTALSIGLLIAVGILVAQRIGAKEIDAAKNIVASSMMMASVLVVVVSGFLLWHLTDILIWLGAGGKTLDLAQEYAGILLPSSILMAIGMVASSVLRALGDAKRSMNATLLAAGINLALDPLFIFTFDMGVSGAAWASVIARLCMALYALYCIIRIHNMLAFPSIRLMIRDWSPIAQLAGPAMLTNLATPIGSTFVMTTIASYGDSAVAAYATIGRIIPVAFSILFALSGAISPIIGQNYGARKFSRIREAYRNAVIFAIGVVCIVALVIFLGRYNLIAVFHLSYEAEQLLLLFCSGLTVFFIADGILFSTNSVFNSLGFPLYSTFFNYAKFFMGVIPCVYVLSHIYGAKGMLIGQAVGPVAVSLLAVVICLRIIRRVSHDDEMNDRAQKKPRRSGFPRPPLWPSSSSKTQL